MEKQLICIFNSLKSLIELVGNTFIQIYSLKLTLPACFQTVVGNWSTQGSLQPQQNMSNKYHSYLHNLEGCPLRKYIRLNVFIPGYNSEIWQKSWLTQMRLLSSRSLFRQPDKIKHHQSHPVSCKGLYLVPNHYPHRYLPLSICI